MSDNLATANELNVFHLNVFTNEPFKGNPATIVWLDSELSNDIMQKLAREFNTPETIYIALINHQYHLRFFTPTQEVNACGHGTIGAAYVANKMAPYKTDKLEFHTKSGAITTHKLNNNTFEYITAGPETMRIGAPPKAIELALKDEAFDCAYWVKLHKGTTRLLLQCKNKQQLLALSPDFPVLATALARHNLFSLFAFSADNAELTKFTGRMFAPNIGISEDPINGNSSIALANAVQVLTKKYQQPMPKEFAVFQGQNLNRAGKVIVHLKTEHYSLQAISLSGQVVEMYQCKMLTGHL